MAKPATYTRSGPIARIVLDDGKVNVMSVAMLASLHEAFDQAEKDGTVVILTGRGKTFSAGFDLKVFSDGDANETYTMLKSGAELAYRLLSFPTPVVAACNGHALPMGAFLLMSSDVRIAAEGTYGIGMNEVAIKLTVPRFAVEVARARLTPAYFNRALTTGQLFAPDEAAAAGFVDWTVPAAELDAAATRTAEALCKIDMPSHHATKLRAREGALQAIRAAIDGDITLASFEERIAARKPAA
jgi:enoyl-CoA hydratase